MKRYLHLAPGDSLYRYEDRPATTKSAQGVDCHEYIAEAPTAYGWWVRRYWDCFPLGDGSRSWFSTVARRPRYHTTKRAALESYIARKHRQIEILQYQLGRAKANLNIAQKMRDDERTVRHDLR